MGDLFNKVKREGIVPILRNIPLDKIDTVMSLLEKNDISLVEITVNSQNFTELLTHVKKNYPHFSVGAGTVTTVERLEQVVALGAEFIVTPNVNVEVIRLAKEHKLGTVIGALSPSEIVTAYEAGADIVKVFPAGTLGLEYLKAVIGPLDDIPLLPTGGINLENIVSYKLPNVVGFGIGGELVNKERLKQNKLAEIDEEIAKFVKLAR